ncbi:MAG: Hpt domain-containing protein [Terracidiphilus sp.]
MDKLTREFLIESQEGLDRMERCLTELEVRPDDACLIGDIVRSVHTIKGTTGFLGFKRLEKLAHAVLAGGTCYFRPKATGSARAPIAAPAKLEGESGSSWRRAACS